MLAGMASYMWSYIICESLLPPNTGVMLILMDKYFLKLFALLILVIIHPNVNEKSDMFLMRIEQNKS